MKEGRYEIPKGPKGRRVSEIELSRAKDTNMREG